MEAPQGLSSREAAEHVLRDGPNTLPTLKPPSPVRMLVAQMTHFFAIMLWVMLLLVFVGLPPMQRLLGGGWPTTM